jgi:enoyl-[acyl-carrier protein] reductase III
MARPARLAVDFVLAAVVVVIGAPLWLLPWTGAALVGRFYGRCGYLFWPVARRAGMMNLRRAYGEAMSYGRARASTIEVFSNLGQSIAEGVQFARRFRDGRGSWERLYEAADPALEKRLLSDPRPKIFVTGHLGSWEIAVGIVGLRVPEAGAVIARRVDNPFVDALVRRLRLRKDSQWIEKSGAATQAYERLKNGDSIAMLLDENGGPRGLFVRFFGRPASTRKTAALLSLATGAPIVIGAAVRRPSTGKLLFKLASIEPEPRSAAAGPSSLDHSKAVLALTQRRPHLRGVGAEDPLQWRWIHWRWKNQPGGLEDLRTSGSEACFGAAKRTAPERPRSRAVTEALAEPLRLRKAVARHGRLAWRAPRSRARRLRIARPRQLPGRRRGRRDLREIESTGGKASRIRANLVHPDEIRAMFAEIRKEGALDFLVHSAALGSFKPLLDLRANQWDISLSVNARSFLICSQEAVSGMAPGGRIVAISSLGGSRVLPAYGAIGVSKAALESLTRSLAWELGPRGILVNAIAAGVIDSPTIRLHPRADEILARSLEQTPIGRLGTVEDVARVVLFLCSPLSAWITGQTLVADGGISLRV